MGLMYLFPTDLEDQDHVVVNKSKQYLKLRSYGLPPLFWFYGLASTLLLALLYIPIHGPMQRMSELGETYDLLLYYAMYLLIISAPLSLFAFFFYEKNIILRKNIIYIVHKVFFLKIKKIKFNNKPEDLFIRHFIDSPNMARIRDQQTMKGFQNKGYFELCVKNKEKTFVIDRASRKNDLVKIKSLLTEF
jgi:hypothetical protein